MAEREQELLKGPPAFLQAEFTDIGSAEVSITLRMTLGQWEKLYQLLEENAGASIAPVWEIRRALRKTIAAIRARELVRIPEA